MTDPTQYQLRVPQRLGMRCQLGMVMRRFLAAAQAFEEIRKAREANVVRKVLDADGREWTEVRELDFGDVK